MTEHQFSELRSLYRDAWDKDLPAASARDIEAAEAWFQKTFDAPLPPELGALWRRADGFGGNGANIMSAEQLPRLNDLGLDVHPDVALIGSLDDVIEWGYHVPTRTWCRLEPGEMTVEAEYPDLTTLLSAVLRFILHDEWPA